LFCTARDGTVEGRAIPHESGEMTMWWMFFGSRALVWLNLYGISYSKLGLKYKTWANGHYNSSINWKRYSTIQAKKFCMSRSYYGFKYGGRRGK
jgi:hypothetical protein